MLHKKFTHILIASVHGERNLESLNPLHHRIRLLMESKKIFVSSPYSKGHVSYRHLFEVR